MAQDGPSLAAEAARLAEIGTAATVAVWTPQMTQVAQSGVTHEGGRAVTAQDAWHVGSLTKAMTATLAARLVTRGMIDWDTRLGDVMVAPPPWADVTLDEFLTHRSGMASNPPMILLLLNPSRSIYVGAMLLTRPDGARGDTFYSNAGYVMAAVMLEKVTGRDWEDLIAAEVFAPLGMEGAGFGADIAIWGHGPAPVPPGPRADNVAAMAPAGAVHLPVADMLRFLEAHATRDTTYLPPEAWARLQTPMGRYAMGWRDDGDGVLLHAGSNTLWMAQMAILPDRGAVFVEVNAGGDAAGDATEEVALRLVDESLPPAPD